MTEEFEIDDGVSRDFYANYYSLMFSGGRGLTGVSYNLTHKALEWGLRKKHFKSCLEIGSGNGEHLEFVKHSYEKYVMIDKYQKPAEHYLLDSRNHFKVEDIIESSFEKSSFSRILMMCVLHHLDNPELTLKRISNWLEPGGTFSLFLPCDPGIFNRVNRKLIVEPRARRLGFMDYDIFHARQHRNHYWGLKSQIEHQFRGWKFNRRFYPGFMPVSEINLFAIYQISKPI